MIIDGKKYGDTASPVRPNQKAIAYSLILACTFFNEIMSRAISSLTLYQDNTIKNKGLNHQIAFYGENLDGERVLAGNHAIQFKKGEDKNFILDCFDFEKIKNFISQSITTMPSLQANETLSECVAVHVTDNSRIQFNTTISGFIDNDCDTYRSLYTNRAAHCFEEMRDNRMIMSIMMCVAVLSMFFCILALSRSNPRDNYCPKRTMLTSTIYAASQDASTPGSPSQEGPQP